MKKFKHKQTNRIVFLKDGDYGAHLSFIGDQIIPRDFIENTNDWEEIIKCEHKVKYNSLICSSCNELLGIFTKIKKDYEILSIIDSNRQIYYSKYSTIKDRFARNINTYPIIFDNNINVIKEIHSVKRLSDGEIFTIGDILEKGAVIDKFYFEDFGEGDELVFWNNKAGGGNFIKNINKIKKPLFITEDGIEIFKESDCWVVTPQHYRLFKWSRTNKTIIDGEKYFSTKKVAEDYIILNKPCLSIKNIDDSLEKHKHIINKITFRDFLKNIVKCKLNL